MSSGEGTKLVVGASLIPTTMVGIDSSDPFNPRKICNACTTRNAIDSEICTICGTTLMDRPGTVDIAAHSEVDTTIQLGSHPITSFGMGIAKPDAASSVILSHNEGIFNLEEKNKQWVRDPDIAVEGSKPRPNRRHHRNAVENDKEKKPRLLYFSFTACICVYYMIWLFYGIFSINKGLEYLILIVLPSGFIILCLSYILFCASKKPKKWISIAFIITLIVSTILRASFWIYAITYIPSFEYLAFLFAAMMNECGIIALIILDYDTFYIQRDRNAVMSAEIDSWACIVSLASILFIPCWCCFYFSKSILCQTSTNSATVGACIDFLPFLLVAVTTTFIVIMHMIKVAMKWKTDHKFIDIFIIALLVIIPMVMLDIIIQTFSYWNSIVDGVLLYILPQIAILLWAVALQYQKQKIKL